MDFSLIPAALSSIKAAKDIGGAALALRDWNLLAVEISKMNDQLIKAQDAIFSHNAQLLDIQQRLFESTEKLRRAEETLAERGRYSLVQVGNLTWVYRESISPSLARSDGKTPDPPHYVCQACFDNGRKVVLQYMDGSFGQTLDCSVCKVSIYVGPGFK